MASHRPQRILRAGQFTIPLGETTRVMGVINVTPDSFSQDGCLAKKGDPRDRACRQARRMVKEGAHILDIGGESSRPGAKPISADEEIRRVIPVLERLRGAVNVPVSVDTYKSAVARRALEAGADIINNIRGTRPETALLKLIARHHAAVVLMHMRGTPRTMQDKIVYRDLIKDIFAQLREAVGRCRDAGIAPECIMIDPGICFGKTVTDNLEILDRLGEFRLLGQPILVGVSRKSFIGQILGQPVERRIWGTAAAVSAAIIKGADILRVHDVSAMAQCARMTDAIINRR